jgi:hypothetical protein
MTKNPDGSITLALPPGVARWTLTGVSIPGEVWAFDWWTQPGVGVASAAAWQATTDALWGVIAAAGLHTQLASCFGNTGNVNGLQSIYYRNSQVATFVGNHPLAAPVVGTSGSFMPLQQALCVTLLTDFPGKSTRGRCYLPACGLQLDANRRFNLVNTTAIMNALKVVLGAGNTDGQYGPPVVVSKTLTQATKITSLRWDLGPDTQRRRANRQDKGARTTLVV